MEEEKLAKGVISGLREFFQDMIAPELRELKGEIKGIRHELELHTEQFKELRADIRELRAKTDDIREKQSDILARLDLQERVSRLESIVRSWILPLWPPGHSLENWVKLYPEEAKNVLETLEKLLKK